MEKMDFSQVVERSIKIRKLYHNLERQYMRKNGQSRKMN